MRKLIKFVFESSSWILIPVMLMIGFVVVLAIVLGSPFGAFVYTLF